MIINTYSHAPDICFLGFSMGLGYSAQHQTCMAGKGFEMGSHHLIELQPAWKKASLLAIKLPYR